MATLICVLQQKLSKRCGVIKLTIRSRFSLTQIWTALLLFSVIVPVSSVMIWYDINSYKSQLDNALTIERQANELISSQIESEIRRFKTLLKNKSDPLSLLVDKADKPGTLNQINTLLKPIVEREIAIHEVMILSTQAKVVTDIDPGMRIFGEQLLSTAELEAVAKRAGFDAKTEIPEVVIPSLGRTYIGTPRIHDNKFAFSIAVPIGTPTQAVLVAIVDVGKLWLADSEHGLGVGKTRDYLLDRRGTLITDIEDSEFKPGDLMTHLGIARSALINAQWPKDNTYIGVNQQPVFGTLTTVPSLGWALVSEVYVATIVAPIQASLLKISLVTFVGMVIFIIFVLALVKRTLNPIQDACDAIAQVAKGDYDISLTPVGIHELDAMMTGIIRMTNSRQQAEIDLQESEQDLIITLNSIGDAVITTDAAGNVTRMNPVAQQLTGWTIDVAQGKPVKSIFSIFNASTREPIPNPVDKVLASGEIVYLSEHTTLISRSGHEYQITDSAAPIRNEEDEILGMVLVFNDVTEQYNLREKATLAQLELQDKEKEQRDMLDFMVNAMISIDDTGTILSFNRAAESLFNYSATEILGENISRLMPEPFKNQHDDYLHHYKQTDEAHIIGLGRDLEGQKKDGSHFPMRLLVASLPKGSDGKSRFIGSCIDLSQVKEQEEQLRRSQKIEALGKLTGGIAHDFNNILGVILGYSDLLKDKLSDQPNLADFAEQIHHAGERGAKLTKRLLSFSRQGAIKTSKQDINKLLLTQQDMLQKTLTVRIKLVLDLTDNVWPVCCDSSELEDAVLNMCINAMHAMNKKESGALLTIRTYNRVINNVDVQMMGIKPGDYVQLSLTDTGDGMDETTKEKVFDPFFSTKGESGTGLGLSQVFGFVQRAGGTIKVYSEEDHGSQFALYFPRHFEDASAKNNSSDCDDMVLSGSENILVVDDEKALRNLCNELLTNQGYTVIMAESGQQALKILEKQSIDLILSDVIMPEMDGYQLATIVQQQYPTVKIQLASGFTDERHINMADDSLHKNLLHKPYNSKELFKSIRNLLDN